TSPDNRGDITQEMKEKGIDFRPRDPGSYSWEPWPTGYDSDICKELAVNNPSVTATMAREVEPKLANNFLKSDNPGVVMTSAEVKFLMAEATVKKWNKQGVRAAMDFLTDNYGCTATTDAEFDAFIQGRGTFGHTDNQKLEAINTQAWILHFTNPAECWANVRRSGYPKLKSPAEYGFGQYLTGGTEIPVRLCYPVLESSYNKKSYNEAIERMGGTDNWHSLLWWDTEN
ncbi:SusD/RagB family nutrient-binding outer membrane lipoprotein, partial [Bacteroides ovatus]